jgi:TRAP-type mannitol/chloroaromatic compound transport system permease small subunit
MKFWIKVGQFIDYLCELLGKIGWVLVIYCTFFGLYDVIMRYAFNKPSLWIGTTIQYAMVLLACVSGAYALKNDAFVKLDVFYANFSPKTKAICDIVTYAFTFIYLYILITKGIQAAQASFATRQVTPTAVPIPLYHLKAIIPAGAFCVLLVATKKLVLDIQIAFGIKKDIPIE